MIPLRQGRIVWVRVFDKQGANPKRRPVILLTSPDQVPEGQPLIGIAVSTQPADPLPAECVRLPSNRQKQGSSRLPERRAAVCDWVVRFFEKDIEEVGGVIYGELLFESVERAKSSIEKAQPAIQTLPEGRRTSRHKLPRLPKMTEYRYSGDDDLSNEPLSWWARWRLRAPWWPYALLAVLFGLYSFWKYRSPMVAMVGLAYMEEFVIAPPLLLGVLAVLRGAQVLVRFSAESAYGVPHNFFHPRHYCLPWLVVIAAGIYFGPADKLPLRIGFWLSRPAMDRLADEALADPDNAHFLAGRWAGVYRITGAEVIGPSVILYLDNDKKTYGFVRAPGAMSDKIHNQGRFGPVAYQQYSEFPTGNGFDDPVGERISGDWFVMYSWYRLVKVGWS